MDKHTLINLMHDNGFSAIRLDDEYMPGVDVVTAMFHAPTQVPVEILHYQNDRRILVGSPDNSSFARWYDDSAAEAVIMQAAQNVARQIAGGRA